MYKLKGVNMEMNYSEEKSEGQIKLFGFSIKHQVCIGGASRQWKGNLKVKLLSNMHFMIIADVVKI